MSAFVLDCSIAVAWLFAENPCSYAAANIPRAPY